MEPTIEEEIVHAADVGLRLATNRAHAIGLAAITYLSVVSEYLSDNSEAKRRNAPVSVNIVVESDLLAAVDISLGEDPHAQSSAYDPLLHLAIRVTGVVGESPNPAFLGRVNVL